MNTLRIVVSLAAMSLVGCSMEEQYPRPLESEPVTAPAYIGTLSGMISIMRW